MTDHSWRNGKHSLKFTEGHSLKFTKGNRPSLRMYGQKATIGYTGHLGPAEQQPPYPLAGEGRGEGEQTR